MKRAKLQVERNAMAESGSGALPDEPSCEKGNPAPARKPRQLILKYPFTMVPAGQRLTLDEKEVQDLGTTLRRLSKAIKALPGMAGCVPSLDVDRKVVIISFMGPQEPNGPNMEIPLDGETLPVVYGKALENLGADMEGEFKTKFHDEKMLPKLRRLAREIFSHDLQAVISDGEKELDIDITPLNKMPIDNTENLDNFFAAHGKVTALITNGFVIDHKLIVITRAEEQKNVSIGDTVSIRSKVAPEPMRCIKLEIGDEVTTSGQYGITQYDTK